MNPAARPAQGDSTDTRFRQRSFRPRPAQRQIRTSNRHTPKPCMQLLQFARASSEAGNDSMTKKEKGTETGQSAAKSVKRSSPRGECLGSRAHGLWRQNAAAAQKASAVSECPKHGRATLMSLRRRVLIRTEWYQPVDPSPPE